MINPAEDIVNLWLQECCDHFTMTNVVIKKKSRTVRRRKVYGGRGKEVDIISTDGSKFFWIEVGVSARPYLPLKAEKIKRLVSDAHGKFAGEKETGLKDRFNKRELRSGTYTPRSSSRSLRMRSDYLRPVWRSLESKR